MIIGNKIANEDYEETNDETLNHIISESIKQSKRIIRLDMTGREINPSEIVQEIETRQYCQMIYAKKKYRSYKMKCLKYPVIF